MNYSHNNRRSNNGNANRGGQRSSARRSEPRLDPSLFIRKAEATLVDSNLSTQATFSEYAIDDKLKRNILDHGYTVPTEIQEQSIPHILEGRDLIGIANTGTGKTAAFLITLINKCFLDRNQRVLIVVPTRELAVQIGDEFRIFAKGTGLDAVTAIGGANIKRQSQSLRNNPHFVIGTPGRLKDLIQRRNINLALFQNIVLDEVDRMVDIGFIHDIKLLISLLPKKRQSLFFSATVDKKTDEILSNFVTDPVTVSVKKESTSNNVEQDVIKINHGKQKIDVLHDLLIQPGFDKVIIFGRTKWGMEKLSRSLVARGFSTMAIHGNKTQNQRQKAITEFKNHNVQILVATDVASRGLDIDDVTHVINYDAPTSYDDYVHRIGRTGRAGKKGVALTFVE